MRTNKVIVPVNKELLRDKTRREFIERIERLELYVQKFQLRDRIF